MAAAGSTQPQVTVLGSANMDLVVRVARSRAVGETVFGTDFAAVPGGKGLNQAVAARRAGAEVAFAGALGRDDHGRALEALLEGEGIGTTALRRFEAPTGVALIDVYDSGDNSIVVCSGANAELRELDSSAREAIAGAAYLVMQFELDPGLLLEAARLARAHGVGTVLTPAPVVEHDPELLELTDVLVLNVPEAAGLTGLDDPARAAAELSRRCGAVVATLGGEGSLLALGGKVIEWAPARAVEAVDTTAAGDTYTGVLTARLAAGDDLTAAMRWATTAASIAVTRPGASTSMPSGPEIEAALEP